MIFLDHLVYAVPDLNDGIEFIENLMGVKVYPGGKHLHFGTHNALVRIGDTSYLEIIAPDPSNPKTFPLWMGLTEIKTPGRLTRWAIHHPLGNHIIKGLKTYKTELANISEGQRQKSDGSVLRWMLTLPAPTPLIESCPFFINWGESDHPTTNLPIECRLQSLEIISPRSDEINDLLHKTKVDFQVSHGEQNEIIAHFSGYNDDIILR